MLSLQELNLHPVAAENWEGLCQHIAVSNITDESKLALLQIICKPELWVLLERFRLFQRASTVRSQMKVVDDTSSATRWAFPSDIENVDLDEFSVSFPRKENLLLEAVQEFPMVIDFGKNISFWLFGRSSGAFSAKLAKPVTSFVLSVTLPLYGASFLPLGKHLLTLTVLSAVAWGVLIPYLSILFLALQQDLAARSC